MIYRRRVFKDLAAKFETAADYRSAETAETVPTGEPNTVYMPRCLGECGDAECKEAASSFLAAPVEPAADSHSAERAETVSTGEANIQDQLKNLDKSLESASE